MGFYDEMQEVATDLLTEFKQGIVQLRRETPGVPDPDAPWELVEPTVETWELKAAVRTVSVKYIDGTLIVAGDRMVTFAVPATVPVMADTLVVDGRAHAMKDLRPLPGAGAVVAYIAFIAA